MRAVPQTMDIVSVKNRIRANNECIVIYTYFMLQTNYVYYQWNVSELKAAEFCYSMCDLFLLNINRNVCNFFYAV